MKLYTFYRGIFSAIFLLTFSTPSFIQSSSMVSENSSPNSMVRLDDEMRDFIVACGQYFLESSQPCSDSLIRCYLCLQEGSSEVAAVDLYNALPELAKCIALWSARASRPEFLANGAPVGANGCNTGAILQALQSLECSLSTISCNATCTAIDDLIITVSNDFINTWTILEEIITTITECCNGTFTVLVDINNTLTACCSAIETLTTNCAHTPICEALTITTSGAYCLCQDIEGVITIAADDVDLDLNSYRISGGANGIIINPGQQRINVHDGNIGGTTDQAIIVGDGARFITLQNIDITDAATENFAYAIDFQATSTTRIADCLIRNVSIGRAQSGINLFNTDNTLVDDCRINDCLSTTNTVIGIFVGTDVPFATGNQIVNCFINNLQSTGFDAAGISLQLTIGTKVNNATISNIIGFFYSSGIQGNVAVGTTIQNSTFTNVRSLGTIFPCSGIYFQDSPQAIIENCQALQTGLDSSTPIAVGLYLAGSGNTIVDNFLVTNVGLTPTAMGFWIDGGNAFTLRGCACVNIMSDDFGYGFNILASDVICQDCSVEAVNSNNNSAVAYEGGGTGNAINNISFVRCHATDITAFVEARGFRINSSYSYVGACDVENIIVPGTEVGTLSRGYDVTITTSGVLLDSCVANRIAAAPNADGFNIEGFFTQVQDCTALHAASTGIIVPSVSSTEPVIDHCRATNCTTGFLVTAASAGIVTNCYAAQNTANYIGGPATAFEVPVGTDYSTGGVVAGFNLSA